MYKEIIDIDKEILYWIEQLGFKWIDCGKLIEHIKKNYVKSGEDVVSGKKKIAPKQQMPDSYSDLKQHLSDYFKTKVQLTCSPKGKGKISIHFSDEEQLERIINLFDNLKDR